jgi:hypothetical protein
VIGFIEHLQTVIAYNYNAVTNLHNLQITTVHAKPSQAACTSRFLVMASNTADS